MSRAKKLIPFVLMLSTLPFLLLFQNFTSNSRYIASQTDLAITSCQVSLQSCPLHPGILGLINDNFDSSASNQSRCLTRSKDFSEWCASESDVTATFLKNGVPVANGAFRGFPNYDSLNGYVDDLFVKIDRCVGQPISTCAFITIPGKLPTQVWLGNEIFQVKEFGSIGPQLGSSLSGIYFFLYRSNFQVAVRVVNPVTAKMVAWVDAPSDYTLYDTYFSKVNGPSKTSFPFIAPGQRYLSKPHWGFLCQFDPAAISNPDPACGTGFRSVSIEFTNSLGQSALVASSFRHNGGWVDDLNGDGIDEINLPFLFYILSIDGRTGARVALSTFDVARNSEPNSKPVGFHSGRLYGSFKTFSDPLTGVKTTLIAAGNAVGSFQDYFCNVSRYVAGISWINTGNLKWSNYISFEKTIFAPPFDSVDNYYRKGDGLNHCVHRFSDSLFDVGGVPATAYSYFDADVPQPSCESEVLAEQSSTFSSASKIDYDTCAKNNHLTKYGKWTVQIVNATNGSLVNAWPGAYFWGRVEKFAPDQPFHFIVETFTSNSSKVRFDQVGHVPDSLSFSTIPKSDWHFAHSGILLAPGSRPKIQSKYGFYGSAPRGVGQTFAGIPELVVRDVDNDGYNDIQLENGKWVGYSLILKTFIIKQ